MSTNYSRTSAQIITRALRIIGGIAQGETASTAAVDDALEALNLILKNLSMEGTILTQQTEYQVNFSATNSEVLGTDGANYQCIKGHTSATANDKPTTGLQWSLYWVKGGTSGVAWANSTAYTSKRTVALSTDWDTISKAYWRKDNTDYEMDIISLADYLSITDKQSTSAIPSTLAIEFALSGMIGYLYPEPDNFTSAALKVVAVKLFDDLGTSAATPTLSANWIDYLTYKLASNLADEYALPLQERAYIAKKAEDLLTKCVSANTSWDSPRYIKGAF